VPVRLRSNKKRYRTKKDRCIPCLFFVFRRVFTCGKNRATTYPISARNITGCDHPITNFRTNKIVCKGSFSRAAGCIATAHFLYLGKAEEGGGAAPGHLTENRLEL
jgi:hypothetical protein